MPLTPVKMRPGVNRESTSLANTGTWYASDKVRFRGGAPEKIGGWVDDNAAPDRAQKLPPIGAFWGVCRNLFTWLTLSNFRLLGLGTHMKYYVQNGSGAALLDITPLRTTTAAGAVTFDATPSSAVITATHTNHGASPGDFVTFSGAVSLGGNITAALLNVEQRIDTVVDSNNYTFTLGVSANGSDTGNGGASVVGAYQISVGNEFYTAGRGWGAGGWGGIFGTATTGWGAAATQSVGNGAQMRLWSSANYGEQLLINPRGGGIYLWIPNSNPALWGRAALLTGTDVPTKCNGLIVTDGSRFVIAFGTNDVGSSVQDPMLVRWSAQEDYSDWTPNVDDQAGSFRLSRGSEIITGLQARQEILVWTDSALYSMQYQGPPFVYGFTVLAENTSIIGPNAAISVNNVTYWMGVDTFYVYNGQVTPLPCTLRKFIYGRLNKDQAYQICAGHNEGFSEIWWHYCSNGSNQIDSYVIYNYVEGTWAYGSMQRTAWLDSPLRLSPIATNYAGQILQHERGTDNGETNPPSAIDAFIESADVSFDGGQKFLFIRRMLPDVTFDGSTVNNPELTMTLEARRAPGAPYTNVEPSEVVSAQDYTSTSQFLVQEFTEQVYPRLRGRQFALKLESNTLGVSWQLGAPSVDLRTSGRRGD
jgi:hypothetical protein